MGFFLTTLGFMKKIAGKILFLLSLTLLVAPFSMAFDGDMDEYHEFKEDLALVRDSYVQCVNMVADEHPEKVGGSWNDLEFEPPENAYVKVEELKGGFKIKGNHGAYKLDAEVRVGLNQEGDVKYEVKFSKGSNTPGKEIAGEVFR